MQNQTKPAQGAKPVDITSLIAHLTGLIADCAVCETAQIHKLTIVVNGRNGNELVNKIFNFKPGSVPGEIQDFFMSYRQTLLARIKELQQSTPMIRLGNQVVSMHDLLMDYTTGEVPAIDADTAQAIRDMIPGAMLTVLINETPHQIQRIN